MDIVLTSGIVSMVLTELAKRMPQVPLNPDNANIIKTVVIALNAVTVVLTHYASGTLAQVPWNTLGIEVVLATILSFLSYKVIPFMQKNIAKEPLS